MKLNFKQTAPKEGCYGDCTADYAVTVDTPCTVGEFLNHLITERNGEWGCVGLTFDNKKRWAQFCRNHCEYKWGQLITKLPERYLRMKVVSISGHGGWSNMDYTLLVKGGQA